MNLSLQFAIARVKKCTGLFLALLMLVSNVGLAFNVHYCGGEIASVTSVYGADDSVQKLPVQKACCAEKARENKSCCEDKLVKLKAKSDVVIKTFAFTTGVPFVMTECHPIAFQPISFYEKNTATSYYCDANAPPLFKLYSQLLLYA